MALKEPPTNCRSWRGFTAASQLQVAAVGHFNVPEKARANTRDGAPKHLPTVNGKT